MLRFTYHAVPIDKHESSHASGHPEETIMQVGSRIGNVFITQLVALRYHRSQRLGFEFPHTSVRIPRISTRKKPVYRQGTFF